MYISKSTNVPEKSDNMGHSKNKVQFHVRTLDRGTNNFLGSTEVLDRDVIEDYHGLGEEHRDEEHITFQIT